MKPTTWAQGQRKHRLERRAELRTWGRTMAKTQYIWRVETQQVAIPDWILERAVPGLTSTADYVFLLSGDSARYLARLDREAGGNPTVDKVRARKCQGCGVWRIGILALERARLDESAVDGRVLPCGPECIMRQKQKRGQI